MKKIVFISFKLYKITFRFLLYLKSGIQFTLDQLTEQELIYEKYTKKNLKSYDRFMLN